ncbi:MULTISPECIES: cyanophycinase [Microbulbifer]|uniref:cyanophycinase n=1 Tax=Microbulbifer TaxID=48073 RepID=UPI001E47F555|nr:MULTISPECIES: cyanophycinase [Microbulbifer]UHQ55270.1 cyanophycinase [Microbulbifer sp. YPW16]
MIKRLYRTLLITAAVAVSACGDARGGASEMAPAQGQAREGRLLIVGGALRSDNAAVYRAFIDSIPAGYPEVAIVPAASGRPAHYAGQFLKDLRDHGYKGPVHVLPVAVRDDPDSEEDESTWARGAFDEKVVATMSRVGGIWFVGGDQTRITQTLVGPGGDDSPLLAAIREQLARGAVVGGTSAGAAIMSNPMIAAGDSLSALTRPGTDEYAGMEAQESGLLVVKPGLGFFPGGIVDQHFDRKSRLGRLIRALAPAHSEDLRLGYGIDEDTAAMVHLDSGELEVIGSGNMILVDARDARFADEGRFAVDGLLLSVFSHGDSYNWQTGEKHMDGAQTRDREAFSYEAQQGAGLALPNSRLDHLLGFSLLDNDKSRELRRYAFSEAGDGVRFRFEQTDDSRGYWRYGSGTKDQYSISDVRLSVEPVAVEIHRGSPE